MFNLQSSIFNVQSSMLVLVADEVNGNEFNVVEQSLSCQHLHEAKVVLLVASEGECAEDVSKVGRRISCRTEIGTVVVVHSD